MCLSNIEVGYLACEEVMHAHPQRRTMCFWLHELMSTLVSTRLYLGSCPCLFSVEPFSQMPLLYLDRDRAW